MKIGDKVRTIDVVNELGEEMLLGEIGRVVNISTHIADKSIITVDVKYEDNIMDDLSDYANYDEVTDTYLMFKWQLEVVEC